MSLRGLLVFDASPEGVARVRTRAAGLSLLDRGVRTMVRAGVERLVIVLPEGANTRLSKLTRRLDVEIEFITWGHPLPARLEPADDSTPTLIVLGDYVHHHFSLTELVEKGLRGSDIAVQVADPSVTDSPGGLETGVALCPVARLETGNGDVHLRFGPPGTATGAPISGAFLVSGNLPIDELSSSSSDLLTFLGDISSGRAVDLRPASRALWRRVGDDRRSARAAKRMLFSQVTKLTSGPISRHLNARLSIPTSKMLVETGLSPHMVTVLLVLTTGLAAAYLFSAPQTYGRLVLAGFLWHMAAVFDRCDGEIARVRLCESRFGAWFDTVTDNIAYFAFLIALVIGIQRLHPGEDPYAYVSAAAFAALLCSLGLMYRYALKTGTGSLQKYFFAMKDMPASDKTAFQRITERYGFLLKRDFFAFGQFVLCLLDGFELMYWLTMIGIFGHAAGVVMSKRRLVTRAGRVELATPSVEALAPRQLEDGA